MGCWLYEWYGWQTALITLGAVALVLVGGYILSRPFVLVYCRIRAAGDDHCHSIVAGNWYRTTDDLCGSISCFGYVFSRRGRGASH